jgi:hypothetical protein
MKYKVENGKLVNENNEVAVAISNRYGAGWSTWYAVDPFDPKYNSLFLKGDYETAKKLAEEEGLGGESIENIRVEWVPKGAQFLIEEYDGAEGITLLENLEIFTA